MSSGQFWVAPVLAAALLSGCGDVPSAPPDAVPGPPRVLAAAALDPLQVAFDDVAFRLLPAMDSAPVLALRPAFRALAPALATGEVRALEQALRAARLAIPDRTDDPDAAAALLLIDEIERALAAPPHDQVDRTARAQEAAIIPVREERKQ